MVRFNLTWLGNSLIALGLAGIIFTFYPLFAVYFAKPPPVPAADSGIYLSIPKINAVAPIVLGVNSQNPAAYQKALEHGVAQAAGTALPGQPGTIYIFAHSSDLPWRLTRYNAVFLRLGELTNGDKITITDNGVVYKYTVFDKKVVWPNQGQYLHQTASQLILQTCTPPGTALERLLIFARPD
ncbi:sortase [Patescibacteria group bacterium]|nr:sortase [Patescibacteria group bacterium]